MTGKNVLLMITPYSQPRMEGIARFAKEHAWNLMIADRLEASETPGQFDGVIMSLRNNTRMRETAQRILAAHVPVVDLTIECPDVSMPRVATDNPRIGRIAALHFLERGFRNLAFFSSSWSNVHKLRFEGFKEALPDDATLERWTLKNVASDLEHAQKPIAVLAYNDVDAARLVAACRAKNISVPTDVAVMGVGNDSFLCENQSTMISSVDQNLPQNAYDGAAMLHKLMASRSHKRIPPTLVTPPGEVVARESSDTLAHTDPQIRAAILCIHANISRPFGAQEVSEKTGIPRRTLDRLFATVLHRSLGCEILRQRMIRTKRLLADPSVPIKNIARACGFCNAAYLTNVFRDETGLTPKAWRETHVHGEVERLKS